MGQEAACTLTLGNRVLEGKALLETDELIFKGDERLKFTLSEMTSVAAKNGELTINHPGGTVVFVIGPAAEKWAHKILNPKSLLDKLGVKPGMRVCVIAVDDDAFLTDLRARIVGVSEREPLPESDTIFIGVAGPDDLLQLASLKSSIKRDGAIWAVFRKGQKQFNENVVLRGGLAAGLVDVKVVRFSDTHTASKFVIRKAER